MLAKYYTEIKQCYNVEKKRFTDGFYITGIQLKEEEPWRMKLSI